MATVVQFHSPGGPEVLRAAEIALPPPAPGEVQVRQSEIGVNFVDIYVRSGLYPAASLPGGVGAEAAGTVAAVGEGVAGFAPGDRVAYIGGPHGSYASARNLPAARLLKLPEGISTRTAAASLLRGMTAWMLLHRVFKAERGQTILIHAAAGGLGVMLTQWAKRLGLETFGTVGSPEKAAYARAHGLDHAILRHEADFAAEVKRLGGRGVDYVADGIGGEGLLKSLACLAPMGICAAIGQAAGPPPPVPVSALAGVYLTRPSVIATVEDAAVYRAAADALFAEIAGGLKVEVGAEFPLAEAARAHALLASGQSRGSILLTA